MPNFYKTPEISPQEGHVRLRGERVAQVPLSQLVIEGVSALPIILQENDREGVVFCHHGVRSAEVTAWQQGLGWQNVRSLEGGLALYAGANDPSIGEC